MVGDTSFEIFIYLFILNLSGFLITMLFLPCWHAGLMKQGGSDKIHRKIEGFYSHHRHTVSNCYIERIHRSIFLFPFLCKPF